MCYPNVEMRKFGKKNSLGNFHGEFPRKVLVEILYDGIASLQVATTIRYESKIDPSWYQKMKPT